MFDLLSIVRMNKRNESPSLSRLTAKDIENKSKAKAQYWKERAKISTVGVACMAIAFTVGVYSNDNNTYASSAISNTTGSDLVELLRMENNRLQRTLDRQARELLNNIEVIPMEWDDCIAVFESFYKQYPYYHYESDKENISIDYAILNPEEDAAQYCDYILNVYPAKR